MAATEGQYPKTDGDPGFDSEANRSLNCWVEFGCRVDQGSSASDMVVDLKAGVVNVAGVPISFTATTQTLDTADATNPRYDAIYLIVDTIAGTVTKGYLAGTPAATPIRPTIPASSAPTIPLAYILVPANDTAITNDQIRDIRPIMGRDGFIGEVKVWLKSYTNTPALKYGFQELSGGTVSNTDSPYNGQTLPDLNGGNKFLRGNSTSGGTGGSDTQSISTGTTSSVPHQPGFSCCTSGISVLNSASLSTTDNKPLFYDVVFVGRIID
ncbi:MAG: hypothetical protein Q8P05_05390 [Candidatus Diapherotrites archaeon]|nr:hypothetical protein [Candidatus Diapherotrites archaeon]